MKRSNQGMTLLEVLVALAIFATAALSVMRSVTQHISTLSFLEEKTLAMKRSDGTGPCFIKRGRIFYFKEDLDAWINECSRARSTAQLRAINQGA